MATGRTYTYKMVDQNDAKVRFVERDNKWVLKVKELKNQEWVEKEYRIDFEKEIVPFINDVIGLSQNRPPAKPPVVQ